MKRSYSLCLAAFLLLLNLQLQAQTNIPALITSDQTWDISGSPYRLTQNAYIDTGVTVRVMPGVRITSIKWNIRLLIDGNFEAVGTKDSIIVFDTMQIAYSKKSLDYNPTTNAGAHLKYCSFSNADVGKRTVEASGTDILIENCTFYNNY
jgi:hypothetical protein